MSRDELRLFSYEILGLVGHDRRGTHDLRRMVKRDACSTGPGRASTTSSPSAWPGSAISRRARNRARRGTGPSTRSPTRASRRCASGRERRSHFTPVKSELLVRLLIADLVGEEPTRESIVRCATTSQTCSARVDEAESSAEALPHRRKYLLLVADSYAACSSCTSSWSTRSSATLDPGAPESLG